MIMDRSIADQGAAAHGMDAARLHLGPSERWYVATTLPRKEHFAAANLTNQNYRSFLPLHLETRRRARQFRTVLAPVFPRYIFIILDVGRLRWRSVNGTLGVQRLITDGDRQRALAGWSKP
jgi:transcription antitermination factor NusG